MNKSNVFKILFVIIGVSLLISLFFNCHYYQVEKRDNNSYSVFLNHFYTDLAQAIKATNDLLNSNATEKQVNEGVISLTTALYKIDDSLSHSALYLEDVDSQGITFYRLTAETISFGTDNVPSLMEGAKLSSEERAFLEDLKGQLEAIKNKLYAKETGQEKNNLDKDRFNEISKSLGPNDFYQMLEDFE